MNSQNAFMRQTEHMPTPLHPWPQSKKFDNAFEFHLDSISNASISHHNGRVQPMWWRVEITYQYLYGPWRSLQPETPTHTAHHHCVWLWQQLCQQPNKQSRTRHQTARSCWYQLQQRAPPWRTWFPTLQLFQGCSPGLTHTGSQGKPPWCKGKAQPQQSDIWWFKTKHQLIWLDRSQWNPLVPLIYRLSNPCCSVQ